MIYKRKIIKELYFAGNLSCLDISDRTSTSLPLATKMLGQLVEEKYVTPTGYAPSTGGRRAQSYSLRPESFYIVSVAMDQYFTRIVMMDMHRKQVTPVAKFAFPQTAKDSTPERLAALIREFILESGIASTHIAGIGIGMPGFVDSREGINYSFLDTPGKGIARYLTEHTGIQTFIENDSRLIALAEFRFGIARRSSNVLVINLGWGVGLGMILNGEYFRGHNGFAGEFSHLPIYSNNKLCSCGKSGCLETEASLLELIAKAEEGIRNGSLTSLSTQLPAKDPDRAAQAILAAAKAGDKFAVGLLSEAGYTIGRGIAILIHLLNPETIVLSGRGATAGKIWQAPIQQALNEHCIPRLAANTQIEISTLGNDAELIGAAALVVEGCYSAALPV
ncbi:MAG TPA: ROK family protein [Puia sp.]|uniref:ROK family protein n=1 Tax=Puia sp. TaxID=2045100 RepID=UPI002C456766|nr:ROK family protein [Puia sp.]HVU97960.1 ROK family protein [Puia sp.]